MKLIDRPLYLDKLIAAIGTPDIKVVTGIRRAGKSKLLEAFAAYLQAQVEDANVIHVNFNLAEADALKEHHALHAHVEERHVAGKRNFLLIDEVQMCEGFEQAINWLHASERYDIYITGSNAFLLSSDLATLFTGRTHSIEVYPFSFGEYCNYFAEDDMETALDRYLRIGGMSGAYPYQEEADKMGYIGDIFDTLVLRDIRQKYKIRYPALLEQIADFLMDNVGNISSARSITSALAGDGSGVSNRTVTSYIDYLCRAFAFYRVRRYDIRGKRYLASGDKYYLADHAFRYAKLGTRNMDYGRAYENMVAIELMRQGFELYAGVLYKKEVDFVALRRSEKLYIQVSDDISSPATFEREVAPLLAIRDAYPKMIIARTRHEPYDHEGIVVCNLADWLIAGGAV